MKSLDKFIKKVKENKKLQILLIVIAFILFILVAFYPQNSESVSKEFNVSNYIVDLENKLSKTLSKVDGAGKVEVVISVESGLETVLAMKTTTTENNGYKEIVETPIIVNGKTVVLMEKYPKVTGVLIVCESNNLMVKSKIIQATISLLDVDKEQVEILKMS